MEWPTADVASLQTSLLIINQGLFAVEAGNIEHRGGKYILQQDDTMSVTCNAPEMTVREIRPNGGVEYPRDEQGCVVFDGTYLTGRGDRYGALDVGIYVPNLDYPIGVLRFELTAPLSVRGEVRLQGDGFEIHRFQVSNAPDADSSHYPYRFEYNMTTDDSESNWHELGLIIERPKDFWRTPRLEQAPEGLTTAFSQGSPARIRLRSERGETYSFKAICKRKEIIRFPEPQPPIQVRDWIVHPKTLPILHERYRYDIDAMDESWQEYPQMLFDSAIEWLEFQPIQFRASADMHLLEDGEFLLFNLHFDVNNCRNLLEIPMDFLQYLNPSIGGENFKFLDLNGLNVDLDSSEISFSFSYPLPSKSINFNPRSTRLTSYYEVLNEGQNFYSDNPFSVFNWNLLFSVGFQKVPSSVAIRRKLCHWNGPAVVENGNDMESKFHPRHAQLYRCVYERMQPTTGMFCPECGSFTAPSGANGGFKCTNYGCGWTNTTPMLADFDEVNEPWYDYHEESSPGIHSYSLNKGRLKTGEYVVSFNGMSFHFKVE